MGRRNCEINKFRAGICLDKWVHHTLLGDAAHAMPTEKGLGGNNVLEDARLLSALLTAAQNPIDWPGVIEKYEREMFARAKAAVQESENAAEYFRSLRSRS